MKFDDSFIDLVRSHSTIVHLVGGYVRLKKSGKDYSALCPFHTEKTPSFLVSESKQIFKCFGCGAGGDVFQFIMLMENCSFPESVRHLAEQSGVPLPQQVSETNSRGEDRSRLLKIMEIATEFFQECLRSLSGRNSALAYLRQRQIDDAVIDRFQLGFAAPGNQLASLFESKGFTPDELLACGLLKRADSGQPYDKFRNRVMFPIRDLFGRTIAFGGRILGEGVPKYLNSPETILYNKSKNLYGLDVTREEIRQRDFAILVEGYFDCIVPFQFGLRNVVASLGTSLTENQVRVLGRYTRKVLVNYDPDSAGVAATMRSIDLFLEQGTYVNIVSLPRGQDPDTFIRREGVAAYQEKIKSSQPYLDFVLSRFIEEQRHPSSPKGKQEIVSQILPYLVKLSNKIERAEYVSRIASRLWVDEDLIWSEIRKMARHREPSAQIRLSAVPAEATPAEKTLLAALLESEDANRVLDLLDSDLFEGLQTQAIFEKAFQLQQQNEAISIIKLRNLLDQGEDLNLIERAALRSLKPPLSEEIIRSSVSALRRKQYERISRQIQEEIKREENQGDETAKMGELLRKKEDIRRKIELDLS